MGCSCDSQFFLINEFNKTYGTNIDIGISNCKIKNNIGTAGFNFFCEFDIPFLQSLILSHNNIYNIDNLSNLEAPLLTKLDLSYNNIQNIKVFYKVKFPLEYLDLSNNIINNIDVFHENKILSRLKRLFLTNNDLNFDDAAIKDILKMIKQNLEKNSKHYVLKCHNDKDYMECLVKLKDINIKTGKIFGIFDKDIITKIKEIKLENENGIINELSGILAKIYIKQKHGNE